MDTCDSILRCREVQNRTGLSKSTIYALAARGKFPKPIKLAERASGWSTSSIQNWIDERINSSGDHQ